jgi:toxin ParE1/3/4
MPEIILSRRARDDFKRIWHYIAQDNPEAADRLLLTLDEKIERLRVFPEIGSLRDDIRPGARTLVHGRYIVLYDFDAPTDTVEIVAVVEAMRDFGRLF